jgi:mRNA interferase MazF
MPIASRDVVLVPFPFRDRLAEKTRPAVVVSSDLYHSQGDIIVAAITSYPSRFATDHSIADWQSASLLKPSTVRSVVVTLATNRVVLHIGRLSDNDWNEVTKRLGLAFAT